MDDRGVARGKCTMRGCNCLLYERQGRVMRCTCGHPPAKHASPTEQDSVRLRDGVDHAEEDLDLQLEQCISLDHTQPASGPVSACVSTAVGIPTATHAWTTPNVPGSLTAGEYQVVLLFRGLQRQLLSI